MGPLLDTLRILRKYIRRMRMSPILDALFPDIRAKILVATLLRPDKNWYLTELAMHLGTQPSSLQREVDSLSKAGILEQRRDGRRVYFKADTGSPVYPDLRNLFARTAGLVPFLQHELEVFGERIQLAFVYGSIARSEEASGSDVDLLIVGTVSLSDLIPSLRLAERNVGRPVNPNVYSSAEFSQKARGRDHFLSTILRGAKQFVKGSENELEAIVGQR